MSQARAAADRLPWLADEPTPPKRRGGNREAAGWAVAAMLLVAGASYWMGAHSWQQQAPSPSPVRSGTTVELPQPRAAQPAQPQVMLEPAPDVRPVPEREVPIAMPRVERRPAPAKRAVAAPSPKPEPVAETAPAPPTPTTNGAEKPLTAWPAWQSQGAEGRIVRIGAFATREQAKLGWRYMVRYYPAVAHLKATVVLDRNSRGRRFYRFQIGTTSQAHSEVLCQRMEKIRLSCAVVGLPWKPRGVER
jgi:outer membrane biosynthesis protein TonB